MGRVTELAGESDFCPPVCHNPKDWRPALEQKMQGMLYSFGALWAPETDSNVMRIAEANHSCVLSFQDRNNAAHIGKGYHMKAMSPGVDFNASALEEARKQRIEILQHAVGRSGKSMPINPEDNGASTLPSEQPEERRLGELELLRNYVAPRRKGARWTSGTVKSNEQLAQPADPSPLLRVRTNEEMHPDSPGPVISHIVPSIAAMILAGRGERSPRQDGVSGWGADSDTSTLRSASNAAIWRCQSKYDDSAEEEQEGTRGERTLIDSAGTSNEPEEPERRDSALAGLEKTQQDMAGEKVIAKSPAADRTSGPPSVLEPFPVHDGRQRRPINKHTCKRMDTQRQGEHEDPVPESVVLEPARYTRPRTRAEKGKWAAECECPTCHQQRHKRVRFDDDAMGKAEEGLGRSREVIVKTMRENRRRTEAQETREGASSWATTGSADLVVGLGIFENPRPAPPVLMHRTMKPTSRHSVFPSVPEFRGLGPQRRGRVTPPGGGADVMATQTDGRRRHLVLRTLSRRFRR